MRGFRFLAIAAVALGCLTATVPKAQAQVSVEVGVAPECPYGYYDVAPYDCAPSGYYGPEWFTGDVFVGVGSWFHGKTEFRGKVTLSHIQLMRRADKPARDATACARTFVTVRSN